MATGLLRAKKEVRITCNYILAVNGIPATPPLTFFCPGGCLTDKFVVPANFIPFPGGVRLTLHGVFSIRSSVIQVNVNNTQSSFSNTGTSVISCPVITDKKRDSRDTCGLTGLGGLPGEVALSEL